jgi:bifunctional non-homologous end joining protein LigD
MDALRTYRKKRDFERTPEPAGRAVPKRRTAKRRAQPSTAVGGAYVIHKHAARALHYDLRLELDGVFKSWAVPKGLGLVPGEKHLAVRVEDHPLDYGDFEGVIPKGEYGGGTVMIWDRGRWHATGGDLDAGKLEFELDGEKLSGAWVLVRMGGVRNADGKNWLLIKRHDAADDAPSTPSDLSVASGRSMREIARARERTWTRAGETTASSEPAPKADTPSPSHLSGVVRKKLPDSFEPQLATLVDAPPGRGKWIHELKFDGYRIVARVERGKARLFSRNGKDWTSRFPEIARAVAQIPVRTALIDGEIVALAANGASNFRHLQEALSSARTEPLVYQVFDLLHLDGYDMTAVAQSARKTTLAQLCDAAGFLGDGRVRYTDHLQTNGAEFYRRVCELGLEGIVSKAADARYQSGRTRNWVKTKCTQHEELVIGGYTEPAGSRTGFGALLLGAFDADGALIYMGRVGTGFDTRQLTELAPRLAKIETTRSPFSTALDTRGVHWVRPTLVAEVEFTERTRDGLLRHPSFRGLREDKDPADSRVTDIERVADVAKPQRASAAHSASRRKTRSASRARADDRDGTVAGVALTHPERVMWPELGITKLQLAQYYVAIERWLLPELVGRPLALLRCPEGRSKACFFQKHPGDTMSDAIPRIPIREKDSVREYMYVEEISHVIRLVQMGVLELHVWGSRVADLEHPDLIVMDLDPAPDVAWSEVIRAAKLLRDLFAANDLASFPRLTGGKGLHVVVPLEPSADWDTVKAFSLGVAQSIAQDDPKRFTTNMAKAKRGGKIFVDYLRNGRGSTAIASYSSRAREGAPIAMPVRWEELTTVMTADRYDIATGQRRLRSLREDPWADFDAARRPLGPEILRALGVATAPTPRTAARSRRKTRGAK